MEALVERSVRRLDAIQGHCAWCIKVPLSPAWIGSHVCQVYKKNHLFVNCHCEIYKVTTHALKCIDKAGGIDNYLLSTQRADVDSIVGEKAKQLVLQALKEKEMASTTVLNGSSWPTQSCVHFLRRIFVSLTYWCEIEILNIKYIQLHVVILHQHTQAYSNIHPTLCILLNRRLKPYYRTGSTMIW